MRRNGNTDNQRTDASRSRRGPPSWRRPRKPGSKFRTLCYLKGHQRDRRLPDVRGGGGGQRPAGRRLRHPGGGGAWWSIPTPPGSARPGGSTCELLLSQHDSQLLHLYPQRQLPAAEAGQRPEHPRACPTMSMWPGAIRTPPRRWSGRPASASSVCAASRSATRSRTMGIWDVAGTGSRTTVDVSGNRTAEDLGLHLLRPVRHPLSHRRPDGPGRHGEGTGRPGGPGNHHGSAGGAGGAGGLGGVLRPDRQESGHGPKMVAALRRLGFDYVFDTNFSADLTIMEEGSEFLERFTHRDRYRWPMFTSCCPGWVRFIKVPVPRTTWTASPRPNRPSRCSARWQRRYFAEKIGVDPHKMFVVSVMPCMAKKSECALPTMRDACGDPDVDAVLTTREMDRLLRSDNILPGDLPEEAFDSPLGTGTGAAVIFGATGGVMDAALRSGLLSWSPGRTRTRTPSRLSGETSPGKKLSLPFQVPGRSGWRWSQRLGNTRKLMEALESGQVPLRLRGGDGLPRRLRRRRRPAHPRRRGVGRGAGRCPVEAGSEGHHPVFPRESGDSVSLPRVPGASAGKEVPPPAPYRSYNMGGCGKRYMVGL